MRTDGASLRYRLWLLRNSLAEIALKNRRVRMPYKRFSPTGHTFWSPILSRFSEKKTFSTPTPVINLWRELQDTTRIEQRQPCIHSNIGGTLQPHTAYLLLNPPWGHK
jgi:hypothetical protein